MKKLVVISQVDPFESKISGTRNYVMNFLNAVDRNERVLLCGYTTSKNANMQIRDNIDFLPLIVYKEGKKRGVLPQSFRMIYRLYRFRKKILSEGDVLHIQRFDYAIPFLFLKKRAKTVVYFHGAASKGYLTGKGLKSKAKGHIFSLMEKVILPKVDEIVTVSNKDEKYYSERFPDLTGKIQTISVPVDLREFYIRSDKEDLRRSFGFEEDHKIFMYVGRFSKVKGIDLIVKAFTQLQNEMPNTRLVLVGDGEEKNNLKELAENLDTKNIHFLGDFAHTDIPGILNCADVLVMASLTEGLPTVILEALACGLYVVSTDVGDIPNIIDDEKMGALVKRRSELEYKNAMKEALDCSDRSQKERNERARGYSAPAIAKKIIDMHKELSGK